jgi:hypothetical protein
MPETAPDQAHAQALDLRDSLLDLHAGAAYPGPTTANLGSRIAGAEDALYEYLTDHRDELGRTDFWHGEYAESQATSSPRSPIPTPPNSDLKEESPMSIRTRISNAWTTFTDRPTPSANPGPRPHRAGLPHAA